MARLIDFDPRWVDLGDRKGLGFIFRCTTGHCAGYNVCLFANPLDGGPPFVGGSFDLLDELLKVEGLIGEGPDSLRRLVRGCGDYRWHRDPKTTTFETLTISPSLDMHGCGHFVVQNGGW